MSLGPAPNRAQRLADLPAQVDLLVVGGGITGAGIALEAARRGVSVLLVEARDFAWGTSSRSSKLVHGGLRYLKEGKLGLTAESVRERDRLQREAPGLVEPLDFLLADHGQAKGDRNPGKWSMQLGLAVYDAIAGTRSRAWLDPARTLLAMPGLDPRGLRGASLYRDATTDDARLVLRVLADAQAAGATVINHLRAEHLLRDDGGRVTGAELVAAEDAQHHRVTARCTIAATGVWADQLRGDLGAGPMLRPLRGSHLLLPAWRLPMARALAFMHPLDGRPVFAYPWAGCTLVGTTDLDHGDLAHEPAISGTELRYLLAALAHAFPGAGLTRDDVLSTWAGVRPVIDSGRGLAPSKESRDHLVLDEQGLITVTGGKLTTFRRIAQDTLRRAAKHLPSLGAAPHAHILVEPSPMSPSSEALLNRLPAAMRRRLRGQYGDRLQTLLDEASHEELTPVAGAPAGGATLWAELRFALRHEQVLHLDDLLLRRTRLGLQLARGAEVLWPTLQPLLSQELGWSAEVFERECARYRDLIQRCYGLPPMEPMP